MAAVDEDPEEGRKITTCAVQLRGLPYKATTDDIREFLGPVHCRELREPNPEDPEEKPIVIVTNRDGRASGFA